MLVLNMVSDVGVLTKEFDISRMVHICIDMQVGYCDSSHPATQDRQEATVENAKLALKVKSFSEKLREKKLSNTWVVHAIPKIMSDPDDFMWGASSRGKKKWAKNSLFGVEAKNNEPIISKEKLSAFEGTKLDTLLKNHNKNIVILSGLYLSECLDATAITAIKEGYDTYIISDLISVPQSQKARTQEKLDYLEEEYGIKSILSDEILEI